MRGALIAIAAVVGAAVTTIGSPTSAAVSTADFQILPAATRFYDSRSDSEFEIGLQRPLALGVERMIANITLFDVTQPSWLFIHACNQVPDNTRPAAAYSDPGASSVNLVPIDSATSCFTLFGNAKVLIDQVASQGSPAGARYVAFEDKQIPSTLVQPAVGSTPINLRVPGVPAEAEAVAIALAMAAPADAGVQWMLADCAGGDRQQVVSAAAGEESSNLFIVPIDATGSACLRTLSAGAPSTAVVAVLGYFARGVEPTPLSLPYRGFIELEMPGFVPLAPTRLFDTRTEGTPVAADGVYRYRFTDLPAGASAVALNITATETSEAGYVTAYPCESASVPTVSNVNVTGAGQTVPNFSIVSLGPSAEICFYALRSTHVFADLAGYYQFGGGDGFVPTVPGRLFDTRVGGTRMAAGSVVRADLTDRVSADASAVVMNVTATGTTGPGFVTVYPCDQPTPTASNVNFGPGETRPNLVTVKLPADGQVCFFSPTATHLIADLGGWYSPASAVGFLGIGPARLLDTRLAGAAPLAAGNVLTIDVDVRFVEAVAWNLTATETAGPGFVTGYPCADGRPEASNVNLTGAAQTVANFALLRPDAAGELCLYTLTGTHLIADQAGIFVSRLPVPVPYESATAGAAVASALARQFDAKALVETD